MSRYIEHPALPSKHCHVAILVFDQHETQTLLQYPIVCPALALNMNTVCVLRR